MRLFTACFAHESSSFSPIPTSLRNFEEALLHSQVRGAFVPDGDRLARVETVLTAKALARGHEVVEGLSAAASPSAPLARQDYESLSDEILAGLEAALPVDAVALFLHGAQLAEGMDDCEGDLLVRIRRLVGPDIPIGVEIDLHGNLTQDMVDNATLIAACLEYPHTDFPERAEHVLDVLENAVDGKCRPVMALKRVPMLGIFHTTRDPMRGFVDRISALQDSGEALSISVAHGFPWADTPQTGAAILVVMDGDTGKAQELAERLSQDFFAMREDIAAPRITILEALDEFETVGGGPVVIADTADNAGGGAAGDATFMLQVLLERGVSDAALGLVWDPVAVDFAFLAGEGAYLPMRIGGKLGPMSGTPLDVMAEITCLQPSLEQVAYGVPERLGRAAAIRVEGIDIVLSEARAQVHSPECFLNMGIDPTDRKLVVVKSAQHFHARFVPIAEEIIYASGPGTTSVDFSQFNYKRLTRPIWPLDDI
nr:M81 family metallopeptidase [uncultured Hyphomonas sp.]